MINFYNISNNVNYFGSNIIFSHNCDPNSYDKSILIFKIVDIIFRKLLNKKYTFDIIIFYYFMKTKKKLLSTLVAKNGIRLTNLELRIFFCY